MAKGKNVDHSARAHALLSASGAERWMTCTPSARFEENFPKQPSNRFADEGTLAHEFAEWNKRYHAGLIGKGELEKQLDILRAHELYTDEMEEQVDKYVMYVIEEWRNKLLYEPKTQIFIEQKFDLRKWIEEGFGTNDSSIYSIDMLEIVDLKYGKGIIVSAIDNKQLKLYALGALEALGPLAESVEVVKLTIVQPRLDSISSWEIQVGELKEWAETEVKDCAEKAYAGEGEFVAGDHCKYCRAKPKCRAIYEFAINEAKLDFAEEDKGLDFEQHPNLVSDEELLNIYHYTKMINDWLKDVGTHLLDRAMKGEKFEGYKLVRGSSRRKFANEAECSEFLELMGYEKDKTHKTKLRGIGEMEKMLGKDFNSFMGHLITKTESGPSLVKSIVDRPALGVEDARSDFADEV